MENIVWDKSLKYNFITLGITNLDIIIQHKACIEIFFHYVNKKDLCQANLLTIPI